MSKQKGAKRRRPSAADDDINEAWGGAAKNHEDEGIMVDDLYIQADETDIIPEKERTGCWHGCMRSIKGIFATRQMVGSSEADREWYVKTTIKELVIYLIFLIILCILTFGMMSPNMYYLTKVISELFLESPYEDTRNNVKGSTQVIDFWRFEKYVLHDCLFWEKWYDDAGTPTEMEDRNVLYENRLLGSPRLRQLRVRNDSCVVHDDFKSSISECYDVYSPQVEDKRSFGVLNGTAWNYFSERELDGTSHWGLLATYSGAGCYADLGTSSNESKTIMTFLKENLWLTRATRAVFLDFTVYNANLNLFCVAKIVFEFPATGGMIPSWSFRTVKLLRYVSTSDYFIFVCEIIFTVFVIYYLIEEILEIKRMKCKYFKDFFNIQDILVLLVSFLCIGFSVYRNMVIDGLIEELLSKPDSYPNFEYLGYWQTQFNNLVALTVFLAWIKIFKYISFNKTMTQLSSTLSRCSKDVAGFGIMFFIVFFAFAQLGYLLFGTVVRDFSTFAKAVFTLLRLILGDFNFYELEAANRILGPIYFLSYVFFVFFVLMNMFLAIINDTYAEVKSEIASQKNEFEIADYFKKGFNNMMGKLGKRNQLLDLQNALKLADANGDNKLTFEEVRQKLRQQNFTDMEIEMLFAKYDLNNDRELDADETKMMLADLDNQRLEIDRQMHNKSERNDNSNTVSAVAMASLVSQQDFNGLSERVDKMENSIGNIVSKIDAVLNKMAAMDRAKVKRRENMNKILNTISESGDLDEKSKRHHMEKMVREELQRWDSDSSLRVPSGSKDSISPKKSK
ncbi:polycystin-2 [Parasteatoda tepidariorum]|uniref:polycystin-2 n=1 Tax=Parasteatoda tepidariorum TaxID=114398 RepID=UPI001C71EE58|nr:polycystin-2 [Parasteatoda tepidariorum]